MNQTNPQVSPQNNQEAPIRRTSKDIQELKSQLSEIQTNLKVLFRAFQELEINDGEQYVPAGEYCGIKFE